MSAIDTYPLAITSWIRQRCESQGDFDEAMLYLDTAIDKGRATLQSELAEAVGGLKTTAEISDIIAKGAGCLQDLQTAIELRDQSILTLRALAERK